MNITALGYWMIFALLFVNTCSGIIIIINIALIHWLFIALIIDNTYDFMTLLY